MSKKKAKYKTYGLIYTSQCINCINEGTYKCGLEIEDNRCKNFKKVEEKE